MKKTLFVAIAIISSLSLVAATPKVHNPKRPANDIRKEQIRKDIMKKDAQKQKSIRYQTVKKAPVQTVNTANQKVVKKG